MELLLAHELTPLLQCNHIPLLDVRAPAEYAQGHVPGAVSFPLFTNEERAMVGTLYKQKGKSQAFLEGLRIVGPKMAYFVEEAARIAPEQKIAIHCWRGGQRSKSMAWLLSTAGYEVKLLSGGYKAYRKHVQAYLHEFDFQLLVLGGKTGCGKTKILHELRSKGQQVLDFEGLANHKGSAFGHLGEQPQPRTEHFENELYTQLLLMDKQKPIWVENESRNIGSVFLPEGIWQAMRKSPLFAIEIPLEARLDNLVEDYAKYPTEQLKAAFHKISTKLGGQHLKAALEALELGEYRIAAEVALVYYDKTYQYSQQELPTKVVHQLEFTEARPAFIADALIKEIEAIVVAL